MIDTNKPRVVLHADSLLQLLAENKRLQKIVARAEEQWNVNLSDWEEEE